MLKMTPLVSVRLDCTKSNQNRLDTNDGDKVGGKISSRSIKNLSNVKKLSKAKK